MKRLITATVFCSLFLPTAFAQSLASLESTLKVDDRIRIVDGSGRTVEGRFVGATADHLLMKSGRNVREWRASDIREVQKRRRDSPWNGWLIGTTIGGAT